VKVALLFKLFLELPFGLSPTSAVGGLLTFVARRWSRSRSILGERQKTTRSRRRLPIGQCPQNIDKRSIDQESNAIPTCAPKVDRLAKEIRGTKATARLQQRDNTLQRNVIVQMPLRNRSTRGDNSRFCYRCASQIMDSPFHKENTFHPS